MSSILTEYNAEEVQEMLREEAWDEGWNDGQAQGMAQGVAQGVAQGMAQGMAQGREYQQQLSILTVLERYGEVSENLKKKITGEKSLEVLETLFQFAIESNSVKEFENKI